MPSTRAALSPEAGRILGKALLRAAEYLGFPRRDLCRVVGVSASSLSRIAHGQALDPATKEGELAALFLRAYRSLDALLGGNEEGCRRWFHAENTHLGGVPAQLVQTVPGLIHVIEYLDAMRGRV